MRFSTDQPALQPWKTGRKTKFFKRFSGAETPA